MIDNDDTFIDVDRHGNNIEAVCHQPEPAG